jgi:RNA polymerase sigma-70 factor, ECF subfamily
LVPYNRLSEAGASPRLQNTMSDPSRTDEFVREFTRSTQRLYAFIFALMGHDNAADDVFQEVSSLAWEKFDEYKSGTNFLAWVCRIARFRVLSHFDAKRRRPQPFSDAFVDMVEADIAQMSDELDGEMLALADCYRKLRAEDRELIDRRYAAGVDTKQVATAVGRPLSTVYRMLTRIHKELLDCVEKNANDRN